MTSPTQPPIDQYRYNSASRVSLATQETALNLDDEQLAEDEYMLPETGPNWPVLHWRHNPDADSGQYGRLFIHDKVSPAEFIANLLKDRQALQSNWFHDFNNLPDGAHYEPYLHDGGNWSNRLIKSSSQRAMASLLNDEGMAGQVDLIYMDPPYNISFRSNFQGMIDNTGTGERWEDIPSDVRSVKAFRDSYQDGVHSYLDQLRVQLIHGRELLRESGSFVMQIGPDNLHYVALLMSEVFGHENHVATIPYTTRANSSTRMLPEIGNWLVWYAKDKPQAKYRQLYEDTDLRESLQQMGFGGLYELPDGSVHPITGKEKENPTLIPEGSRIFRRMPLDSDHESPTGRSEPWNYNPSEYPDRPEHYPDVAKSYECPTGRQWSVSHEGLNSIAATGRMDFSGQTPNFRRYLEESPGRPLSAMWSNLSAPQDKRYIVETPHNVLQRILLLTTDPGDLVLDPTGGFWRNAVDGRKLGPTLDRHRFIRSLHCHCPREARHRHTSLPHAERLGRRPPERSPTGTGDLSRRPRNSFPTQTAVPPRPCSGVRTCQAHADCRIHTGLWFHEQRRTLPFRPSRTGAHQAARQLFVHRRV